MFQSAHFQNEVRDLEWIIGQVLWQRWSSKVPTELRVPEPVSLAYFTEAVHGEIKFNKTGCQPQIEVLFSRLCLTSISF